VDDYSAFSNYLRHLSVAPRLRDASYSRGDELLAAVKLGDPPDSVLLDVIMRV